MISIINRLLGNVLSKAWLAVGAVAAAVAIYWRGGTAAKQAERERQEARRMAEHAEAQGRRIDVVKTAEDKRDEVRTDTDDDLADRVRRWTKDS